MSFEQFFAPFQIMREHPLLQQLAVVVIYALLAKLADLFIDRVVKKVAQRTSIKHDEQVVAILHCPLCWSIFSFGLLHALLLFPPPIPYQTVLPAAIKSGLIILWLVATVRVFNLFVQEGLARMLEQGKIGSEIFLLVKNLVRVVILLLGAFWVMVVWEINLTPLFASAGIAGIAVALAAKDTLANFFGGISIFADKTFKVGDYIIIDNGQRGEVVEVGIRSTRIKTRDDVMITIPNSILSNSKIVNESAPIPRYRIRIPVGVAYESDLEMVEKTLLEVVNSNPEVIAEPAPRVRYRAFGDSSINLELMLWIEDPSLKGRETHRLIKAIHRAFGERGITIPFPQRDVHLKGNPPPA